MPIWIALVLGAVEGLTEFLPVSSTGHLVLASRALGLTDATASTFDVVVQAGALVAVIVHYRALLGRHILGLVHREPATMRLVAALLAGFMPAAILGVLARKAIKAFLFKPLPVALALFVGGVVMIVVDRWARRRTEAPIDRLEDVTPVHGLWIGLAQCASLWPGTSRAMSTIVGGQLCGLSTATAAEFSFLLAIPVLTAATMLDAAKDGAALVATREAQLALLVGLLTSFLVAWAVIATFLRFLRARGLAPFGWYRMLVAVAVLVWMRR